jgi:hypothetical protein
VARPRCGHRHAWPPRPPGASGAAGQRPSRDSRGDRSRRSWMSNCPRPTAPATHRPRRSPRTSPGAPRGRPRAGPHPSTMTALAALAGGPIPATGSPPLLISGGSCRPAARPRTDRRSCLPWSGLLPAQARCTGVVPRPPGRSSRPQALSTERLARSQHSTSVWMTASKLPAGCPSSGRSVRTTRQPVRVARYSPGQAVAGRQAQPVGEGVGLGHGGEAVGAPVAADDPLLDLAGCWRGAVAVALLEQGSRLLLVSDRHDPTSGLEATRRCSGRRHGRNRRTAACSSGRSQRADARGHAGGRPTRRSRTSSRRRPRRTWRTVGSLVPASSGSLLDGRAERRAGPPQGAASPCPVSFDAGR